MSPLQLPQYPYLNLELTDQGIFKIYLDRPSRRNAMNQTLVHGLISLFSELSASPNHHPYVEKIRICILRGKGGHFCAGGDVEEMSIANSDQLKELNRAFGTLLLKAQACPFPMICILEGAVMGGGFGLASVADFNLSVEGVSLALPEVRLGLIPAQIAPFVAQRIGTHKATQLALTAKRMNGQEGMHIGLITEHYLNQEELEQGLERLINLLLKGGPRALRLTKALIHQSKSMDAQNLEDFLDQASEQFIQQVHSKEGKEGLTSFLERRQADWC